MIHHADLNRIRKHRRIDDFYHPDYGYRSLVELGPTILHYFGHPNARPMLSLQLPYGKFKNRKVLFILADGLGYRHFVSQHKSQPFFKLLSERGDVYPITSVFPSTTPAALTTIHTGLTPQEHGLPEWLTYFAEFDRLIETLPFKTREMHERDALIQHGGSSAMLFEGHTIYSQLRDINVQSFMFLYWEYSKSAYSNAVHVGSEVIPYSDGLDLMQKLLETIRAVEGPAYFFVYWTAIDSVGHQFGPNTPEHTAAIRDFNSMVCEELLAKLDKKTAADTVLLLSADHGQSSISGEDIINLNDYSEVEKSLRLNRNGIRILPAGSPHDVFLFLQPDKVMPIANLLKLELVARATVLTTRESLEKKLYGFDNNSTIRFLSRIGDLLILPYAGYHVWYNFPSDAPFNHRGVHGGLSEDEMIIPLCVAPLINLIGE